MSTFINPAKIRELAATGDAFYRGAAWILDQQDAAWQVKTQGDAMARAFDRSVARDAIRARLDR